jgi:hypothetical protein
MSSPIEAASDLASSVTSGANFDETKLKIKKQKKKLKAADKLIESLKRQIALNQGAGLFVSSRPQFNFMTLDLLWNQNVGNRENDKNDTRKWNL